MKPFSELIREARKALGFTTAKEFHRRKSDELSMSYESYANLEAGKYLPPADRLTGLLAALEIEDVKAFIFSYCHTLMPDDLFKNLFLDEAGSRNPLVLKTDGYTNYKEKFQALLEFNRIQSKNELSDEQVAYLETDLCSWDIINLFISTGDDGLSLREIAEKTDSGLESTSRRVSELIRIGMLKELAESGDDRRYLVTRDAFIIPRRPLADGLTHSLVKRELDQTYNDKRNRPYTRFRFMSIDPQDRDNFETFVDNFILDSRRFKKSGGKTHYLHVLFSDRNDL